MVYDIWKMIHGMIHVKNLANHQTQDTDGNHRNRRHTTLRISRLLP